MTRNRKSRRMFGLALAALSGSSIVVAQTDIDPLAEYRALIADDNPAELWVARGEELWKAPRGSRKVSLERCDLGLGPGVVRGAYAALPRYFSDAKKVMDLETRLAHCIVTVQGMAPEEVVRHPYGAASHRSDFEALAAYVVEQSRGMKITVPLSNAHERKAYALGEQMFFYRAGTHDFSCATCHSDSGARIRLQQLPNLTEVEGARKGYSSWPAYRVSQGELRTMQWRLNDCLRQQRLPDLGFASEASIALITYLAHNADGGVMAAPGIKR